MRGRPPVSTPSISKRHHPHGRHHLRDREDHFPEPPTIAYSTSMAAIYNWFVRYCALPLTRPSAHVITAKGWGASRTGRQPLSLYDPPVKASVLDGFGEVRRANGTASREVGDCPGNREHPAEGAGR